MLPDGKKKLKLLVIGLDGATFDVILPLIKENKLPTLKKILENGVHGELDSTLPPLTAPAWISFMTGKNPGSHGITFFVDYDPRKYDSLIKAKPVTSNSFAGSTFIDLLSSQGYKIGVITVPMTYPPWTINGLMISGYPCPDTGKMFCCSEGLRTEVKEKLISRDFSLSYKKYASREQKLYDGFRMIRKKTDLAMKFRTEMGLDCLVIVFGATDRVQHEFWKYHDSNSPLYEFDPKFKDAISATYEVADGHINRLLSLTDQNTRVFIISDHGAASYPKRNFNINGWLKEKGLLTLNEGKTKVYTLFALLGNLFNTTHMRSRSLLKRYSGIQKILFKMFDRIISATYDSSSIPTNVINWKRTKAFGCVYYNTQTGGIIINVKGRQEEGIVEMVEKYEELRDYIIEELKELRDPNNGRKVIQRCNKREEIYSGEFIEKMPDILFCFNKQYKPGDGFSDVFTKVPPNFPRSGLHSQKGIFIMKGPMIKRGEKIKGAEITDIAPTVLHSMELSIPKSMDGRVLCEIFIDEFWHKRSPEYHYEHVKKREYYELSRKEREEIKERLKALGYI